MANKKPKNQAREEKEKKKAEAKAQKEQEAAAKAREKEQNALVVQRQKEQEQARKEAAAAEKKQKQEEERNSVMTTGQFLGAFVLLLIPGLNVFVALVWALGGSKYKNKIHFTRAAILFFIIEILLTALLASGVYFYATRNESTFVKKADEYSNGLLTYFGVSHYNDVSKLKNIPEYLVDPDTDFEDDEDVPTRVIENPEEIKTYEDFETLYEDYLARKALKKASPYLTTTTTTTTAASGEKKSSKETTAEPTTKRNTTTTEMTTQSIPTKKAESSAEVVSQKKAEADAETIKNADTLEKFLKKYGVDPEDTGLVVIVIDNQKENNCVIVFDLTGEFQSVPTIRMDNKTIYLGGVN